jgi:rhodanese-related sulfurtransferase
LKARPVREGANLTIVDVRSPGELFFRERIDDIWFADPIRVYLDLLSSEGRGKEMAEHLRREKIGF